VRNERKLKYFQFRMDSERSCRRWSETSIDWQYWDSQEFVPNNFINPDRVSISENLSENEREEFLNTFDNDWLEWFYGND
jgi:hypothetical protein